MKKLKIKDLIAEGAIIGLQDGNHGEKHPTAADYVDRGIPFLMARDFRDGRIDLDSACKIPKILSDSLRIGFARAGDVLLTHKGTVGLVGIVPCVDEYVMLTPQVTYYRTDPEILSSLYLKYAFQGPNFQAQLSSFSAQSTRPYIGITAQKELWVHVPEKRIQQRIASILSAYDDMIENSQRRIKILEEMARKLYREWFVHFRFPGHEGCRFVESPLGEIPEGWEVKTVEDSFVISGGGTPSRKEEVFWEGGTIQWYSPSDLTGASTMFMDDSRNHITELGLAQSSARMFPARSVMLTSRATIGAIAINTHPACTNQGFITCLPNDRVPLYFLFHWLAENVPTFQRMSSGSTFREISRGVFKTIEFLHPPVTQVTSFEAIAEPIAEQILALQRQIQNIRRTRDLLLPRLLSGQIDVEALPGPAAD
jgi:type I restriction enzyme S subunit